MTALILAGGDLEVNEELRALAQTAQLIVAADSGLRHAAPLGVMPDLIVGDFDSVEPSLLEEYPDVTRIRHPQDKDQLDLELAIGQATANGSTRLVILATFGTRFDQSLAALLIASRVRQDGQQVSLHDGRRDVFPLAAGDSVRLEVAAGTLFSVIALTESSCSVTGARWPLKGARLPVGVGRGLANTATATPVIELHHGSAVVIVERWLTYGEATG